MQWKFKRTKCRICDLLAVLAKILQSHALTQKWTHKYTHTQIHTWASHIHARSRGFASLLRVPRCSTLTEQQCTIAGSEQAKPLFTWTRRALDASLSPSLSWFFFLLSLSLYVWAAECSFSVCSLSIRLLNLIPCLHLFRFLFYSASRNATRKYKRRAFFELMR